MELIQHTMFTVNVLAHKTTEELFQAVLEHGFMVCSAGTTTNTEMYRILRRSVNRAYRDMCRHVCELYRRTILPMKGYDLRQIIDLVPKCESCGKDVSLEGQCAYDYGNYAHKDLCCLLCAPEHYKPFTQDTYDAAIAWRFYGMIEHTNIMLDEIKIEIDLLRLVKRTMEELVE